MSLHYICIAAERPNENVEQEEDLLLAQQSNSKVGEHKPGNDALHPCIHQKYHEHETSNIQFKLVCN